MTSPRFIAFCLASVLSLGALADLDRLAEDVAYGYSLTVPGTKGFFAFKAHIAY